MKYSFLPEFPISFSTRFLRFVLVFTLLFAGQQAAYSQCTFTPGSSSFGNAAFGCGGPVDRYTTAAGYISMPVVANITYELTTCGSSFDTQITGWNSANRSTSIFYNDDNCGLQSYVSWTSTFTGTIDVQLNQYPCGFNTSTSAILHATQLTTVTNTTSNATVTSCTNKALTYSLGGSAPGNPTPTWSIISGGGSISGTTYNANGSTGNVTVRATLGVCTSDVTFNVTATAGDPNTRGTNQWNVYVYNGTNFNTYYGYYTESASGFNTANRWGTGASPSDASGYQGCLVGADNHSYTYRRQGFTCGMYQLNIPTHDDDVNVVVNGNTVINEVGCCHTHNNIYTGVFSSSTAIDYSIKEGGGGSQGALDIVDVTNSSPRANISFTPTVVNTCPSASNGSLSVALNNGLSNIKKIRITQKKGDYMNLAEIRAIEVFTGTNVALASNGTTANQYSLYSGTSYDGAKMIDGSTGTMYHSTGGINEWVEFTFNTPKNLDYIEIVNRGDCCWDRANNLQLDYYDNSGNLLYSKFIDAHQGQNYGYTYTENVLDVSWTDGATTLSRTGLGTGSYTLNYADALCRTGSSTSTIGTKTAVGITNATAATSPICSYQTTTVTANGVVGNGAVVTWYTGPGGTGTNLGTGTTKTVNPGTYYARVTGDCGSAVEASVVVGLNTPGGNPATFGNNVWLAYGWNAGDATGGSGSWSTNYAGFNTISTLSFDSRIGQTYSTAQSWDVSNSLSYGSGWSGCAMQVDNMSFAYKRQGFPCGIYQLNIPHHDDQMYLFINGQQVFQSACCFTHSNVWTGYLGTTSTVEIRAADGGGGADVSLELVNVTNTSPRSNITLTPTVTNNPVCPSVNNATVSVALNGGLSNIKKIRITQNQAYDINLAEFRAVEIFTGTNVAASANGGTAATNSLNGTYPPSNLIDGNTGNFYHTNSTAVGNYVEVTFNTPKNLDYIEIINRGDCCQFRAEKYYIEYYDNSNNVVFKEMINAYQNQNFGYTYTMNVLDVSWAGGGTSLSKTGLAAGTYTLNYADYVCRTGSSATTITNKTNVGITSATTAATPICPSATTTVTANGVVGTNAVVTWYSGPGGTGTNYGTGVTKVVGPGIYYARVTGDCGSAVEASVVVGSKVNAGITSATAATSPICPAATTTVTANGVTGTNAIVTWYTGAGGTGTNLGTGTTKSVGPGTYYARVTGDCGAVEASVIVGDATPAAVTVSGGTTQCMGTVTLTASGGAGGTVYFQGTTSNGTSTATPSTSQVISTSGTYYFRSQNAGGCWGAQGSAVVNIQNTAGTDGLAGSNVWNAYAYNSQTLGTNYTGYYTDTRLGFTTTDRWNQSSQGPGSANATNGQAYQGCAIIGADNFSLRYKRTGFPCGNYTIQGIYDDGYTLSINGTQVAAGPCCTGTYTTLWTGYIGAATTIEYTIAEGGGDAYAGLNFILNNALTITSASSVCAGGTIGLTANNANGIWSVTAGGAYGSVSGSTFTAGTFTGAAQTVTVQYALQGCTTTQNITVNGNPVISNVTAAANPICASGTTTLTANGVGGTSPVVTWYTGPNGTGTNLGTGPTKSVSPGTYYARVTGSCGSAAEASIVINSNTNVGIGTVTSSNGTTVCTGGTVNLTANSVTGTNALVTWYTGAGGTGTNLGTGPTLSNRGAGTYYARVTGDCGTPAESSIVISTVAPPTVSISGGGSSFCTTTTVTLTANPGGGSGTTTAYLWESSPNNSAPWTTVGGNTASVSPSVISSTYYRVTYTQSGASCGPATSPSVLITINAGPFAATTWTGAADNNWHNQANWTNCVPGAVTAVTINSGAPNYPATYTSNPSALSLTINSGGSMTLGNGYDLTSANNITVNNGGTLTVSGATSDITLSGNWTNGTTAVFTPGTSAVIFIGSGTSTITSGGDAFYKVTSAKTGGGTVTLGDNFDANGTLTVSTGTFEVPAAIIAEAGKISNAAGATITVKATGALKAQ